MPSFPWSRAMTANQVDDRPLGNWQYRRVLSPSYIRVLQRATTTGVRTTIYSGSMTVLQRAPVHAGAIVLQNDRDELKALLGERLCVASSGNIAAVAGQNGFATLANIAGSGVLLVVLAAYFEPTTAGILQVSLGIGAPLGAQQGV